MKGLLKILNDIKELRRRIKSELETIRYYDSMASLIPGPVYGEENIHHERTTRAPFEKWIGKKLDMERKVEEDEIKLKALIDEATTMLEGIDDLRYRYIVLYRDVLGLDYLETSKRMKIARSTAYRFHAEAIAYIELFFKEDNV